MAILTPLRGAAIMLAVAMGTAMSSISNSAAAADESLEYAVKAAYLYKFGDFVTWPAATFDTAESPIDLCLTGQDPFRDLADKVLDGQRIGGHPIMVRRLSIVTPDSGCQILFVGGSDEQSVAAAIAAVRGSPVLTVTDSTLGSSATGVIHFVVKDDRVRFEIDDQAAALNGLSISSKLLSLATSVKRRS